MSQAREPSGSGAEHWSTFAKNWELIEPPLRPAPEDLHAVLRGVSQWGVAGRPPQVVVMGVTPELFSLQWPAGAEITAVDRNQGMIDLLWPGPPGTAICADWTNMPLADGSRDIAVCDGGLTPLHFDDETSRVAQDVARVIRHGGLFIVRLYVQPEVPEEPQSVVRALVRGEIPTPSALRLRLWTALQKDPAMGTAVSDVWKIVHEGVPDPDDLAARIGWSERQVHLIDVYRENPTRYYFPSSDDVCRVFCGDPGGFELVAEHTPSYDLGDRCPTLVLRRR